MHLDPTDANLRDPLDRGITGPTVMLSLLRLRDIADYHGYPELAPTEPISDGEAYLRYMQHTEPFLAASGGTVLLQPTGGLTGQDHAGGWTRSATGPPYAGWLMRSSPTTTNGR